MILDVNPKEMDDQILVTDPTTSTSDPLAPETPKEQYVDPQNEEKVLIEKDGDFYKIKLPYIIIKGEIGNLFTNSLNKLFKIDDNLKDDNVSGLEIDVSDSLDNSAKGYLNAESFFYATDMKEINKESLSVFLGEMMTARENFKNIICYIDPNDKLDKNIDLVVECLKENDIELYFNKDYALERLKEITIDKSKDTI